MFPFSVCDLGPLRGVLGWPVLGLSKPIEGWAGRLSLSPQIVSAPGLDRAISKPGHLTDLLVPENGRGRENQYRQTRGELQRGPFEPGSNPFFCRTSQAKRLFSNFLSRFAFFEPLLNRVFCMTSHAKRSFSSFLNRSIFWNRMIGRKSHTKRSFSNFFEPIYLFSNRF